MESLRLPPGLEATSPSKGINLSKNEAIGIHVEDTRSQPANQQVQQIEQGLGWLQLNSDFHREDPAVREVQPALSDISTTEDEDNQAPVQQKIASKRLSEKVSQASSATEYYDISEGTIQDRVSVRTDPTETFASAFESRPSGTFDDTDSVEAEPPEIPLRILTFEEISKHNKLHDMWLIINNEVYDVTQFQHRHPGGPKVLYGVAGKDGTKRFDKYHRRALLESYKPIFRIGVVQQGDAASIQKKGLLKKFGFGKKKE